MHTRYGLCFDLDICVVFSFILQENMVCFEEENKFCKHFWFPSFWYVLQCVAGHAGCGQHSVKNIQNSSTRGVPYKYNVPYFSPTVSEPTKLRV